MQLAAAPPEGVRRFTSYEGMCADPDLDADFIGTPSQLHAPVGLAAAHAGKHVLSTSPLADSEAAAWSLVDAFETGHVIRSGGGAFGDGRVRSGRGLVGGRVPGAGERLGTGRRRVGPKGRSYWQYHHVSSRTTTARA